MATRDEFNISAIAQILKLLSNLRTDILIARIKVAEVPFEGVDLIKREIVAVLLSNCDEGGKPRGLRLRLGLQHGILGEIFRETLNFSGRHDQLLRFASGIDDAVADATAV